MSALELVFALGSGTVLYLTVRWAPWRSSWERRLAALGLYVLAAEAIRAITGVYAWAPLVAAVQLGVAMLLLVLVAFVTTLRRRWRQ